MPSPPFHVQVAEALGWSNFTQHLGQWHGNLPKPWSHNEEWVPYYGIDWSATGPLIVEFNLSIDKIRDSWVATSYNEDGIPSCWHFGEESGFTPCDCLAPDPQIAVCNWILINKL